MVQLNKLKEITSSGNLENNLEKISKRDIAIIGISGKFGGANNLDEFWANLKLGKDCIDDFPKDRETKNKEYINWLRKGGLTEEALKYNKGAFLNNVDGFDYKFFGMSPKEASLTDPNQRVFVEAAWEAIEDAGYSGKKISGSNTGVFVGYSNDFYHEYSRHIEFLNPSLKGLSTVGNIKSIIASRIAYLLDLHGPSLMVDTACSSSLVAVHLACKAIRDKECDMAIAGGVKVVIAPTKGEEAWNIGIRSSTERTKTFDDSSDGTGMGEGVGAILLKPLYKALEDGDNIHAVIKGSAINQDGNGVGITTPNPVAQEELILKAWEDARVEPETISYIEAHGTGTKLGDPIEISGIERAFSHHTKRKQFCGVGSVKSIIGHTDSAAGISGLMKLILSMKYKQLPPTIHLKKPNRNINFEISPVYVNDRLQDWNSENKVIRCGINSFGLSGTNCHVVLEEKPYQKLKQKEICRNKILTISAKDKISLLNLIEEYNKYFSSVDEEISIGNVCYTAAAGRKHFNHRIAIMANDKEEFKEKLENIVNLDLTDFNGIEGVFYGQCKEFNENINNSEVNEKLSKIYEEISKENESENKEFYELCEVYVAGADIDWEQIYSGRKNIKVSLPKYQFNRAECWIAKDNESSYESPKLIGECIINTFNLQVYLSKYKPETHWILNEHMVGDKYVVPGTTYIEIINEFCQAYKSGEKYEIQELTFMNPLIVNHGEIREVNTIIQFTNENINVSIVSKLEDDETWIKHAQAYIRFLDNIEDEKINVENILKRCPIKEVIKYDSTNERYIKTGLRWNNVKEINLGTDEALLYMDMPEDYIEDFQIYGMHPSLMDTAANVAINYIGDGVYLPWLYKNFTVYGSIKKQFYSHIIKKKMNKNAETAIFDITLIDMDNNVIAKIKDYTIKKVHDAEMKFTNKYQNIYYEIKWIKEDIDFIEDYRNHNSILIFKDEKNIGNEIVKELRSKGRSVVEITIGEFYKKINDEEFVIGNLESDYIQLINEVKKYKFTQVIHLAAITERNYINNIEELIKTQIKGVYSLNYIIKALVNSRTKEKIDIVLIVEYLNEVNGNEKTLYSESSTLIGFGKTVQYEYPNLKCRCIDIDDSMDINSIINELDNNSSSYRTAYRDGIRYIEEITKKQVVEEINENKVKQNGTYIITGGLGDLGFEISRELINTKNINLILLGKTNIEQINNNNSKYIKRINELKAGKGNIEYYSVDISNYEEMKSIIEDVRSRYLSINGVIHCAGVAGEGFIINKSIQDIERVLKPKVEGTWILDNLTKNDNLDIFVAFSSINAIFTSDGLADYTAANEYLDAFTYYRRKNGKKSITINWPAWKEVGLAVKYGVQNKGIFHPLSTEKALKIFNKAISSEDKQVIVGELNYDVISSIGDNSQIKISDQLTSNINYSNNNVTKRFENKEKLNGNIEVIGKSKELISDLELEVAKIWAEVLGLKNIDVNSNFYELGGDSIMATHLLRQIEKKYSGIIDISDIFTYSTVSKMSEYIGKSIEKNKKVDCEDINDGDDNLDEILAQLAAGEISAEEANDILSFGEEEV